jgi:hypothetical protein
MVARNANRHRRGLLVASTTALLALGGCTTGGGSGGDDSTPSPPPGSSADAGADGDANADTPTAPSGSTEGEGDPGGTNSFGETVRYEDAFAIEGTIESDRGSRTVTARIDGEDSYWRFERSDGTVTELYAVDGTDYVVSGDRCLEGVDQSLLPGSLTAEKFEADRSAYGDVTPTGRETVDGEAVLRYEIEDDGRTVTYHVSAETGYPRRVTAPSGVFEYHSWGAIDPITTPDVPCEPVE